MIIKELSKYENELKAALQQTDSAFLEGESRFRAERLHGLIE
jgi:hypothetical protein